MKEFINEIYDVVERYRLERGMTYAEACGLLKLMSDELSERCRSSWKEARGDDRRI